MAVQKSRVPRSRRGMRRAHDSLDNPTLSITPTGETHRRHHISPEGNYKGRRVINHSVMVEDESNEE